MFFVLRWILILGISFPLFLALGPGLPFAVAFFILFSIVQSTVKSPAVDGSHSGPATRGNSLDESVFGARAQEETQPLLPVSESRGDTSPGPAEEATQDQAVLVSAAPKSAPPGNGKRRGPVFAGLALLGAVSLAGLVLGVWSASEQPMAPIPREIAVAPPLSQLPARKNLDACLAQNFPAVADPAQADYARRMMAAGIERFRRLQSSATPDTGNAIVEDASKTADQQWIVFEHFARAYCSRDWSRVQLARAAASLGPASEIAEGYAAQVPGNPDISDFARVYFGIAILGAAQKHRLAEIAAESGLSPADVPGTSDPAGNPISDLAPYIAAAEEFPWDMPLTAEGRQFVGLRVSSDPETTLITDMFAEVTAEDLFRSAIEWYFFRSGSLDARLDATLEGVPDHLAMPIQEMWDHDLTNNPVASFESRQFSSLLGGQIFSLRFGSDLLAELFPQSDRSNGPLDVYFSTNDIEPPPSCAPRETVAVYCPEQRLAFVRPSIESLEVNELRDAAFSSFAIPQLFHEISHHLLDNQESVGRPFISEGAVTSAGEIASQLVAAARLTVSQESAGSLARAVRDLDSADDPRRVRDRMAEIVQASPMTQKQASFACSLARQPMRGEEILAQLRLGPNEFYGQERKLAVRAYQIGWALFDYLTVSRSDAVEDAKEKLSGLVRSTDANSALEVAERLATSVNEHIAERSKLADCSMK